MHTCAGVHAHQTHCIRQPITHHTPDIHLFMILYYAGRCFHLYGIVVSNTAFHHIVHAELKAYFTFKHPVEPRLVIRSHLLSPSGAAGRVSLLHTAHRHAVLNTRSKRHRAISFPARRNTTLVHTTGRSPQQTHSHKYILHFSFQS